MAQRPTIRRKANWRFGKSRRPARPVCAKRSNETVSQALDSALRAGRVSGDTGLFQDWLCVKGLQGRGAPLVRRLKAEYERGVVGGDPSSSRPASARPLTIAPEGTYNMPPQSGAATHAQITRYKGIAIEPAGDGWTTNLDRQSHFDTQTDAQRFIDAWAKGGARNPRGGGVLNSKTQRGNPVEPIDAELIRKLEATIARLAGSTRAEDVKERQHAQTLLKFYGFNQRFPQFSDYELGKVGRNPNLANPASVFDYEDAERAGRQRAQGLPRVKYAASVIRDEFNIWWRHNSGMATPGDKPGNYAAYKQGWKRGQKEARSQNPAGAGGLRATIASLRSEIAKKAQAVYDAWDPGEDGDDEYGGGGICDEVNREIQGVLAEHGIDVQDGGQDGDDHAWTVAYNDSEVYGVDIPPGVYETGGGYSWEKREGVTIRAADVEVFPLGREAVENPARGRCEDGEDGGLDEGPVDPYPGPDVSDIADVLVVANPAGVYRINIVPRSIGGRYALEVRHPDGHYETPQDFANPEYAKDWAERFYKSFYGPYEVLPRLVWKADRSHWGHYSASFKAPKGKRNPNPPNDSLRSPATDTADREGAQTGARDALAGRPKLSKAEAIAAASHYVRHYNETTPSVGDFYYYSYESIYDYTRGQMKGFTVEPLSKKEAAQEADRLKRAGYLNITTEKYKSEYGGLFYRVRAVSPSLRTHPAPHRARMENPARATAGTTWRVMKSGRFLRELDAPTKRAALQMAKEQYGGAVAVFPKEPDWDWLETPGRPRGRYRNPGPEADRLYESFHGCPPEETVLVETEVHEHDHLTQLGDLTELKIKTLTGLEATIDFEKQGVMLCSSEDGKQLYFEGGNQELDLGELDMDGDEWVRDLMVIGELTETTYRTQKAFDKFKTIDYYHENGEDSGVAPDLLYDPISRLMRVAGGQYEVKPEGIVN